MKIKNCVLQLHSLRAKSETISFNLPEIATPKRLAMTVKKVIFFVLFTVNIFADNEEKTNIPYQFIGEVGAFFPSINEPEHYLRGTGVLKLDLINGCKITPNIFVGAGFGYRYYRLNLETAISDSLIRFDLLPLFFYSKFDFPTGDNFSFIWTLGLGHSFNLSNSDSKGLLFRFGTGLDFGLIHTCIEYEFQRNSPLPKKYHLLGISLGIKIK